MMDGMDKDYSHDDDPTPMGYITTSTAENTEWRISSLVLSTISSILNNRRSRYYYHYDEYYHDDTTTDHNSHLHNNYHSNDHFALEREEHRWLQEQSNNTTTGDGDDGGSSSGSSSSDTLAIFSAVMTNVLLFFLIFCLSATVNLRDLRHQLSNRFAIGTGVAMQFVIMPFLGFLTVIAFTPAGYTQAMGVSLLVVTASPGGSYSNWWCSLFNASLALSVGMTSVSSLLSVGLLPANLCLYGYLAYGVIIDGDDVDIVGALDFGAIFITLGVVMGAILSGLYIGYKYDNVTFHRRINLVGSFCGITLILFSAFLGSGVDGAETNFWSLPWSFYVGTAFPCAVGMTLANIVARSFSLPYPEIVAISIECCYQNTAIATATAVTMFSDPTARAEAVSVPLFYGVVEAVIIGVYCLWAWKAGWTKAPSDEKLCVVMMRTYEVQNGEAANDDELDRVPDDSVELTWWQKCFVAKYPNTNQNSSSKFLKDRTGNDHDDDRIYSDKEETRTRFYSADTTVATNLTTPPGTPDVAASSAKSSSSNEDPENPTSVRSTSRSVLSGNLIPVIDEEEEDSTSLDGVALGSKREELVIANPAAFMPDLSCDSQDEGRVGILPQLTELSSRPDDGAMDDVQRYDEDGNDDGDIINA